MQPTQRVRIWDVQDRRSDPRFKRPWLVRWTVDGRERVRTHRTRMEAERFRGLLLNAERDGSRFDPGTGEPVAWSPPPDDVSVHAWARSWLASQWDEWQPRTRDSAIEDLSRFIALVVRSDAPSPPSDLRRHLRGTLRPDADVDDRCESERWLNSYVLGLSQLDRAGLATVVAKMGVGANGRLLAARTADRYRRTARSCIRRAVDLQVLREDPWPPPERGRSRRKSVRSKRVFDVKPLPQPTAIVRAIDAIESHQPASRKYKVMTAIAFYAGLRPSEVVMLRCEDVTLPTTGWGRIDVRQADISFDEPGEPKTGPRNVPIPAELVGLLRSWVAEQRLSGSALLFRTRSGQRPTASNWLRAWHRAATSSGLPTMRIYDCRHAAATIWLNAGVPLAEVARRLGHTVETLVSTYVGALDGDEQLGNARIDNYFAKAVG